MAETCSLLLSGPKSFRCTPKANQMIKELFENFGKGGTLDKLIKRKEEENDGVCWERIIVAPSLYFWPEEVRGNVELEAKEKEQHSSIS